MDSRLEDNADDREQASLIQQKHDVNVSYAEERAKQMEDLNVGVAYWVMVVVRENLHVGVALGESVVL